MNPRVEQASRLFSNKQHRRDAAALGGLLRTQRNRRTVVVPAERGRGRSREGTVGCPALRDWARRLDGTRTAQRLTFRCSWRSSDRQRIQEIQDTRARMLSPQSAEGCGFAPCPFALTAPRWQTAARNPAAGHSRPTTPLNAVSSTATGDSVKMRPVATL